MAEFVRVPEADWKDILDAAREKTGRTEKLLSGSVAAAVRGIETGGGGGLAYDIGEFVLDADTVSGRNLSVPHNLGAVPDFICVWTDNWAGLTSENPVVYDDTKQTAVGFIYLKEITGMIFRASSVNSGVPLTVALSINNEDYRVSGGLPSSGSYGIDDSFLSETTFSPPTFGANGPRYRAGVTYKYFVSKAWWNVGGVANAE